MRAARRVGRSGVAMGAHDAFLFWSPKAGQDVPGNSVAVACEECRGNTPGRPSGWSQANNVARRRKLPAHDDACVLASYGNNGRYCRRGIPGRIWKFPRVIGCVCTNPASTRPARCSADQSSAATIKFARWRARHLFRMASLMSGGSAGKSQQQARGEEKQGGKCLRKIRNRTHLVGPGCWSAAS
jgi:hypothetical protein